MPPGSGWATPDLNKTAIDLQLFQIPIDILEGLGLDKAKLAAQKMGIPGPRYDQFPFIQIRNFVMTLRGCLRDWIVGVGVC